MIENGEYYLVTTDGWFYGPDAQPYKAAWGKVEVVTTQKALGFNPSRSTNWFLQVGEGDKSILIAGCQIHYALKCSEKPFINPEMVPCKTTGLLETANVIYVPN